MGNNVSAINENDINELKPKSVDQIINYIATKYILTMDFNNLKNLYDKQYCDKLVILTADVLDKYFTEMDITIWHKR